MTPTNPTPDREDAVYSARTCAPSLSERIRSALLEDLGPIGGHGDVTSRSIVPADRSARGRVLAKRSGTLSGIELLPLVFEVAHELSGAQEHDRVEVHVHKKDGSELAVGDSVAEFSGNARSLLLGERTALNLIGRMTGVATLTARYVDAVSGTKAKILDTRKTTPLWRDLEKHAVKCGGGENHRIGLYDMTLIKDNHLALWGSTDVAGAVREAKNRYPDIPVEVEVVGIAGLQNVCMHGDTDYVLLDNFSVSQMREAVEWCHQYYSNRSGRPLLEASGGITLDNVREYADTGVDRISIGALTHSALWFDLSMDITP